MRAEIWSFRESFPCWANNDVAVLGHASWLNDSYRLYAKWSTNNWVLKNLVTVRCITRCTIALRMIRQPASQATRQAGRQLYLRWATVEHVTGAWGILPARITTLLCVKRASLMPVGLSWCFNGCILVSGLLITVEADTHLQSHFWTESQWVLICIDCSTVSYNTCVCREAPWPTALPVSY